MEGRGEMKERMRRKERNKLGRQASGLASACTLQVYQHKHLGCYNSNKREGCGREETLSPQLELPTRVLENRKQENMSIMVT